MNEQPKHFAVCIKNDDHAESLELRKIYEIVTDPAATTRGMLRVIDEEGDASAINQPG